MKALVVYSSLTGNTRSVAEAVLAVMPEGAGLFSVEEAPEPDGYDFLALGFWVNRARPDPRMLRYMEKIKGKNVALFGTLAAWPGSDHALETARNAGAALEGNRVLGCFLCQGRLEQARFEAAMSGARKDEKHPMTPERRARLLEAACHPDERDFERARQAFRRFLAMTGKPENAP